MDDYFLACVLVTSLLTAVDDLLELFQRLVGRVLWFLDFDLAISGLEVYEHIVIAFEMCYEANIDQPTRTKSYCGVYNPLHNATAKKQDR